MQSKSLIYSSDTRLLLTQAIYSYRMDATVSYDNEPRRLYISIPHIGDYRLDGDSNSITIEHIRSIVENMAAEGVRKDLEEIVNELTEVYL
jgi:hypothetical protein